ncbi:MAG: tetratricopeptide repeat protein [Bacteroidales bacterium]|nr:tetratricopeptide repeat protein [Bacteroidales bacterium]
MRKLALILATLLFLVPGRVGAQESRPTAAAEARQQSVLETMLIGAVASMQSGDVDNAIKHLEYLNKNFPGNDAVNYWLGVSYALKGRTAEAEACIQAAAALDTANVWYKDNLASLYLSEGKGDKAADIYLKLLESDPGKYTNAYTLSLLGNQALSEYKDSLALESFEKALVLSPDYTPAILGKSEVYRMRGNIPGFFASVNEMVQNPALNPSAKCDYVNQLLQHIDYGFYQLWRPQLDSLVTGCASVHPTDSSALRLAGSWFYGTERKEKGREYFTRFVEAFPENLDAQYLQLQVLMDEGSTAREIIDQCETIIRVGGEKNPRVMPALATIGDTYHQLGQDRNAYKAYERALKADPEYLPVLNNYAYYLCLTGKKLKKAEAMSKITVEKDPDNATYLDTYGWILYLRKKYQQAKPYFKHAMLYGGRDSAVILEHYAKVLDALGEKDLAQSFYMLAEKKKSGQ